jgi:hypothetical protein
VKKKDKFQGKPFSNAKPDIPALTALNKGHDRICDYPILLSFDDAIRIMGHFYQGTKMMIRVNATELFYII